MGEQRRSNKQCVLTEQGRQKLEAALKQHFGYSPSNLQMQDAFGPDPDTIAKIRNPHLQKGAARNSIEKLFGPLNLDLEKSDYVQLTTVKTTSVAPNPFGARGCVDDPQKFLGREALLRQIFEELEKGGSRALIGPAGMGKSSILRMICKLGPERLKREAETFIYLDMHMIRDENSFFEELCVALDIDPPCSQTQIGRKLKKQKCSYVLCLDELHVLSNEAFFPEATRNWLRGMAEMPDSPLQLVLASQQELRELFPDRSIRSSPLADFFDGQIFRLHPLSLQEVESFLQQGLQGTNVQFSKEQINQLWVESQGIIRQLQQLAAALYSELTE